jgi:hypothetical protein
MVKAFDRAMTMALTSFKQLMSSDPKPAGGCQWAATITIMLLPISTWFLLPAGIVALIRMLPLREGVRLANEENDRRQRKLDNQAPNDT